MNLPNLKRAFNYMLTVKPEEFNMGQFLYGCKSGERISLPLAYPCNTVGCIIGKCAEKFYSPNGEALSFCEWAEGFFDLKHTDGSYIFLFHSAWASNTETATLEQALLRMKFVIDFGRELLSFTFDDVMTIQSLTPYEI